jgi:hypothetical protein
MNQTRKYTDEEIMLATYGLLAKAECLAGLELRDVGDDIVKRANSIIRRAAHVDLDAALYGAIWAIRDAFNGRLAANTLPN